jgi:hypothetical protein
MFVVGIHYLPPGLNRNAFTPGPLLGFGPRMEAIDGLN